MLQTRNKALSEAAVLPRLPPIAEPGSGARLDAPEARDAGSRCGDGRLTPLCGRGERSSAHTFQLTYAIVPAAGLLVEVA